MLAVAFRTEARETSPEVLLALQRRHWSTIDVASEQELVAIAAEKAPDLVILCCSPAGAGPVLAAASRLREEGMGAPLVLVVSGCDAALAIAAMRSGVSDVLPPDGGGAEVDETLRRLFGSGGTPRSDGALVDCERLVGRGPMMEKLRRSIRRAALSDSYVLISGETGTGKELAADLIHRNSKRRHRPFVSINCAAIPEALLESELFGYERGAFTGAQVAREGKLQYAHGGTFFLDEVGDMKLYAQAKLLRAIEGRTIQRLGGHREIPIDVRVIAATNQRLEHLASQQRFRQDLFFRLNVIRIHMPALREHRDDIPDLVEHLLAKLAPRLQSRAESVDTGFLEPLLQYTWPGNVRELRNVIESALVFCAGRRMTRRDLPPELVAAVGDAHRKRTAGREEILRTLRTTGWNRNDAARLLGCSRMTLYRHMVKYKLFEDERAADERVEAESDVTAGRERNGPRYAAPRADTKRDVAS